MIYFWLVVSTPLQNMIIPSIWKNKKCSKPPTRFGIECFHINKPRWFTHSQPFSLHFWRHQPRRGWRLRRHQPGKDRSARGFTVHRYDLHVFVILGGEWFYFTTNWLNHEVFLLVVYLPPVKNMSSSDWIIIPTFGENKIHVPNHQPVFLGICISKKHGDEWWFPLDFNINPWSPTAWPPERTPRTPNAERRRALSGGRNRPRLFAGSVGPWRGGVCPGEAEITWRLRCPICHMRGAVLYICILRRTIFLVFKFLCFNNSIYL